MNIYESNRPLGGPIIVCHANTLVRPSKLASEGMNTTSYKSAEDEESGDDVEH